MVERVWPGGLRKCSTGLTPLGPGEPGVKPNQSLDEVNPERTPQLPLPLHMLTRSWEQRHTPMLSVLSGFTPENCELKDSLRSQM